LYELGVFFEKQVKSFWPVLEFQNYGGE